MIVNPGDLTSRITAIEEACLAYLGASAVQVRDIDIDKLKAGVAHPAAYIATETGTFTKQAQGVYACELRIYLVLLFHNVKDERARRRGLYPILEGAIKLLMGKTLGLDIKPLKPVRFRNVTTDKFRAQNLCAFELEFAAGIDFRMEPDRDDAAELVRIGLAYYLQDTGDDGRADSSDVITLKEDS